MKDIKPPADLVDHLCASFALEPDEARRLVIEVTAYFHETASEYAIRRHREMQAEGVPNPSAFDEIARELEVIPVRAGPLSARQIRRIIYG